MDSIEIIHLTLTAAYHEKTGNVLAASNGIRDASEQNALEPNVCGRSSSRIPPIPESGGTRFEMSLLPLQSSAIVACSLA